MSIKYIEEKKDHRNRGDSGEEEVEENYGSLQDQEDYQQLI